MKRFLAPLAAAFLLIPAQLCPAQAAQAADSPAVNITALWLREEGGRYAVNADLDAAVNASARNYLQNGVAVPYVLQVRLNRTRRFLPDETIAEISWRPVVRFDPLKEKFLLESEFDAIEFSTLPGLLETLNRLRSKPLDDARITEAVNSGNLYIRARFEVDYARMPAPVQIEVLTGDWEYSSGWRDFALEVRP